MTFLFQLGSWQNLSKQNKDSFGMKLSRWEVVVRCTDFGLAWSCWWVLPACRENGKKLGIFVKRKRLGSVSTKKEIIGSRYYWLNEAFSWKGIGLGQTDSCVQQWVIRPIGCIWLSFGSFNLCLVGFHLTSFISFSYLFFVLFSFLRI